MRALRFSHTGSLEFLRLSEVADPAASGTELLVKVAAAAVNPSDVKNVLGKMHETTLPRIPGRDFSGVVEQGPADWIGRAVFGTGGDLGFSRDGSHAEFVVVPQSAAVVMPRGVSFAQAAAIGLPYLTAYAAVISAARLQGGETILIVGATGSVGGAAVRLAKHFHARVIGVARTEADISRHASLPADSWIDLEKSDLASGCQALTAGRGADIVLDTLGGAMFEPCLAALARHGRQVAISSGEMPRVSFNLVDFYHNESTLVGVDTLKWGFSDAGDVLRSLVPNFESGVFPPPDVREAPLSDGPATYKALGDGSLRGKIVLTP